MIYLDTGCLLKLYYPEPNSAAVAAAVTGKVIASTELHELETMTALQLKRFRGEATLEQVEAALQMVREDLSSGKLDRIAIDWSMVLRDAVDFAKAYTGSSGCRALDVLHCAVARALGADEFVSSDARQIVMAAASNLRVVAL